MFDPKDTRPPLIRLTGWYDRQTDYMARIYLAGEISDESDIVSLAINDTSILRGKGQQVFFSHVRDLAEGRLDVLLFTSAQQVVNLLRVADDLGLTDRVRQRLAETVVASVGPTTSEALRDRDLPVDVQPEHPKLGPLVLAAASQCHDLLARKKRISVAVSAVVEPSGGNGGRAGRAGRGAIAGVGVGVG